MLLPVYILVFHQTVSCLVQKLICSGSKIVFSTLRWCWKRGCRSREETGSSFTSCCPVILLQVQPVGAEIWTLHSVWNGTLLSSSVYKVWHAGASDKPHPHPSEPRPGGEDREHSRLPAQTESNQVRTVSMGNASTFFFFAFGFLIIMRNQEMINRRLFCKCFPSTGLMSY